MEQQLSWPRILLAGVTAGIIVNSTEYLLDAFVFTTRWEVAIKAFNKPYISANAGIALLQLLGFLAGIAAVRFYAGMFRVKPSRTIVLISAVCSWAVFYLLPCLACLLSKLPGSLIAIIGISSLCELIAGTFVGGWIYRESLAASERAVAVA